MSSLRNILFIDIETVSQTYDYPGLSERMKSHWARKAQFINRPTESTDEESYLDKAGIFAEFGKIVTIGIGFFLKHTDDKLMFKVKALKNDNEEELLNEFNAILSRFQEDELILCAHNGKEFDFPYLCRRMLINRIKLPYVLDLSGKKPWEANHLDTLELWKFGDRKHYTSLDLLAEIFGIESSKTDFDGSMVNSIYHECHDLNKIAEYCMRDVAVLAQLYLSLRGNVDFDPKNIIYAD